MLLGSLCSLAPLITVSVVPECHTTNNAFFLVRQLENVGPLLDRYSGVMWMLWSFSCLVLYCRSSREDPLAGIQIYFFSI